MRYQAAPLPVPSPFAVRASRPFWSRNEEAPRTALLRDEDSECRLSLGSLLLPAGNGVFKTLARAEGGNAPGGDEDSLAGLRIATLALFAIAHDEVAERNQLDFVALNERSLDLVEQKIDEFADLTLRELHFLRQRID